MPTEKRQRQKEGQRVRREAALAAARRRQRTRRLITFAVLAAAVLLIAVLASQFGSDKKKTAASTTTTTAAATTTSTSKANAADKPKIDVPTTPAPTALVKTDLKVGTGRTVKLGDTIEVNYVGVSYADGKEFDSSWTRGSTAVFPLKVGGLIKGWTDGIPGMKVGGRRELIIPGDLAYGNADKGDGRPFGALIFIVDIVSIQ